MIASTVLTVVTAALGRILLERWLNHVTLYAVTWGLVLFFYHLDLIHYYPITSEAWGYIVIAWIEVVMGAAIVAWAYASFGGPVESRRHHGTRGLAVAILVLSSLAAVTVFAQWAALLRQHGDLMTALFQAANERYQARILGDVPGEIRYVGVGALSACALAGAHAARLGRLTWISLAPLLVVALQAITAVGRMDLALGGALFLAGSIHAGPRGREWLKIWKPQSAVGWTLGGVGGTVALVGTFTAISLTRGLDVNLPGVDPAMGRISAYAPIASSLYSNLSAPPVTFSEYLKAGAPRAGFATNTLAPIRRALSRVGVGEGVPQYEEVYWTPVPSNVGTYLKNTYADFGPAGMIVFPFLLSAATTLLFLHATHTGRLSSAVTGAHLFVVVLFSFNFNIMMLGKWLISLAISWVVATAVDRRAGLSP